MSKYVADKIADKLFPGIKKFMKEHKWSWHENLSQPYDKTMHPMYVQKQTEYCNKRNSEIAKKRTGKKKSSCDVIPRRAGTYKRGTRRKKALF